MPLLLQIFCNDTFYILKYNISNIYFFNHKTGVSGQVNSKKGAKVKNVLAIIVVITLNVLIHFAV